MNGISVATQAATGTIQTTTTPLRIGGNVPYGEYFQGRIDDVRVYNRALTAAEIQTDMATPVGGIAPGDTVAPSAPGAVTATAISATQVDLSWGAATDNVAVTIYRIERCTGVGCTTFSRDRDDRRLDPQRSRPHREHDLSLSGAGGRCCRQPRAVYGHRDGDHAGGRRYRGAQRTRGSDRDRGQQHAGESELGRGD